MNDPYDIATNGERRLLRVLSRFRPTTLFDVGANVGHWTMAALAECPTANIHAFEIMERPFTELARNVGQDSRVTINPFGLSNSNGAIEMHDFGLSDQLASFVPYPHGPSQTIDRPVRRGLDYMLEHRIDHIDLLKIDVEGAEHLVLEGFGSAIDDGRIDAIQFEYGKVNILTHVLLIDFYLSLSRAGYAFGKVYPDRVDFRPYSLEDEDFVGPNYLAVRQSKANLISALRG